jgi:hypothetical protein
MKYKVAAFALLFVALSILALYSIVMYQQVPIQEDQAGQVLDQVKITRFEYNSSDPYLITGTYTDASFLCSITYDNPSDKQITISGIEVFYYRSTTESKYAYIVADGFTNGPSVLNPGSSIFPIELKYNQWTTNLPETNNTTPFFHINTIISQGPYTRYIGSNVSDNRIENTVDEQSVQNAIYNLRSFYSTLAVSVWIIGLQPAFAFMLLVSKSKLSIERWAACVLAVNVFSIIVACFMWYFPQHRPVETSFTSGHGSGGVADAFANLLLSLAFIGVGGLNLFALASLLRHSPRAKSLTYLASGFMAAAGFILSFVWFSPYGWPSISFWVAVVLAAVNVITLLRLRLIYLSK